MQVGLSRKPYQELIHKVGYLTWVWQNDRGARDAHGYVAVVPRRGVINSPKDKVMNREDILRSQAGGIFSDECLLHKIKCSGMIGRLQVLFKAFASHREPLLNHDRSFVASQRIPFDSVACIGEFDPKPVLEIAHELKR